jgi:hypothetical protein
MVGLTFFIDSLCKNAIVDKKIRETDESEEHFY